MDELLQDFLTETSESLANIDNDLVAFESNPDNPELIRNIFRMVHTIKGTCGFIGLSRLGGVAHAAENVLGLFRDGTLTPSSANIGVVLEAIDLIKAIVAGIEASGSEPQGDDSALLARLEAAATSDAPAVVAVEEMPTFEPEEEAPAAATVDAAPAAVAATAPTAANVNAGPVKAAQTIRVSVDLLENLMTAVSELVLTRNQLMQGLREVEAGGVQVPVQRLSQIVSELQEGVMKTRMQPIGNAWQKLPRLVRDLAHEVNKKIDLQLIGAETEVDRQVLEIIKDPLTHMVRNSADHGLETTEDRIKAGKSETGQIRISACHQGGHIMIEVSDDGKGLSVERIRRKAVDKGLVTEAAAAQLTDAQVHRFIFDAGFSTAAQVTAVSGRGVGMDVVRTNIEKIGGSIDLTSEEGKGVRFQIRIPLTLAIVSALIVESVGERFAVPQLAVLELLMASQDSARRIETLNGAKVLRVRDRLLPLVHLDAVMGVERGERPSSSEYVLVLQAGAQCFGLVVDRVLDTEEIVVKPVAPVLKDLDIYAGNTILGDGSVIMILDPNGLAGSIAADRGDAAAPVEEKKDAAAADRVGMLVFEASPNGPICAVPLDRVDRIEDLDLAKVETMPGRQVVQYRGALMPLVQFEDALVEETSGKRAALVFSDANGAMGLVVHRIVDVVETELKIGLGARHPGSRGAAIINGRATEIVNVERLVARAWAGEQQPVLLRAA